jgi:hypothetical protein
MKKTKRKIKRIIRNGLLYLTLFLAMVVFVCASLQIVIANPFGTLAIVLSGGYILAFTYANCEV